MFPVIVIRHSSEQWKTTQETYATDVEKQALQIGELRGSNAEETGVLVRNSARRSLIGSESI